MSRTTYRVTIYLPPPRTALEYVGVSDFIDIVPPKHPKNYGSYSNGNPPAKRLEGDNVDKPEKEDAKPKY